MGGMSITTFGGDGASEFTTKAGITGGVIAGFHLKKNYQLETGILYSDKGAEYNNTNILGGIYSIDFNYFELPVSLKYQTKYYYGFMVSAGFYIGYLEKATLTDVSGDQADITKYFKKYDVGLNVSIGYQFESGLGLGLRYEPGLSNIFANPSDPNYGGSNNNKALVISMFYLQ
jgi:hypothetical protein